MTETPLKVIHFPLTKHYVDAVLAEHTYVVFRERGANYRGVIEGNYKQVAAAFLAREVQAELSYCEPVIATRDTCLLGKLVDASEAIRKNPKSYVRKPNAT